MNLDSVMLIYRKPNITKPAKAHKGLSDLLGGLWTGGPNNAWGLDISYLPMVRGCLYLVINMGCFNRKGMKWRITSRLGSDFCHDALNETHPPAHDHEYKTGLAVHPRRINKSNESENSQNLDGRQSPLPRKYLHPLRLPVTEIPMRYPDACASASRVPVSHAGSFYATISGSMPPLAASRQQSLNSTEANPIITNWQ
ncbi:MAG: hypothetical protein ACRC52_03855 [Aeromonas veronii]